MEMKKAPGEAQGARTKAQGGEDLGSCGQDLVIY